MSGGKKDERAERLAKALRENLRRRKAAARDAKEESDADPVPAPPPED